VSTEGDVVAQKGGTDDFVHGVVTADILAEGEKLASSVEQPRRVKASGLVEAGLPAPHLRGESTNELRRYLERVVPHGRYMEAYRLDGELPAQPAARSGDEIPLPPALGEIDPGHGRDFDDVRERRVLLVLFEHDGAQLVTFLDDAFRVEKAGGELLIVARAPHDDGHALTVEPDLERLLDGDVIVSPLTGAFVDAIDRDPRGTVMRFANVDEAPPAFVRW